MALNAFFDQIISGPVKIAMIGSGCSVATEPTAEVSHYYNITHVRKYTLSVVISSTIYLLWTTYSRKFLREKTFSNSAVLWLFAKFGIVASFGMAKASNPQRFSRWNRIFLQIHESFLPRKFPAISYLLSIEVSSLVKVQEDRFTQWSLFFLPYLVFLCVGYYDCTYEISYR